MNDCPINSHYEQLLCFVAVTLANKAQEYSCLCGLAGQTTARVNFIRAPKLSKELTWRKGATNSHFFRACKEKVPE